MFEEGQEQQLMFEDKEELIEGNLFLVLQCWLCQAVVDQMFDYLYQKSCHQCHPDVVML